MRRKYRTSEKIVSCFEKFRYRAFFSRELTGIFFWEKKRERKKEERRKIVSGYDKILGKFFIIIN